MIPEFGHFFLIAALVLSLVQIIVPWLGLRHSNPAWQAIAKQTAFAQSICTIAAMLALVISFAVSDFSVVTVADNSHSTKPLLYKITAAWGNHEGSLLLWVMVQSLFGAVIARNATSNIAKAQTSDDNPVSGMTTRTLIVLGVLNSLFLLFLLFKSNPFLRIYPVPLEGLGFNPLLQDPAIAYHPPTLYFGYIGFAVPFAYSIAALWQGTINHHWARNVRPFVLFSWLMLTAGIAAGAWWAYYELGWGGWWFWDPVENASLLPWLTGTALLHSLAVMEKRESLKLWVILLSVITFGLSLLGTFLTRSGVLTSVHSFAVDTDRGLFILGILIIVVGGGLLLFALRASKFLPARRFHFISREGGILANNILLTTSSLIILLGTIYPLILDALHGPKVTVGASFYAMSVLPVLAITVLLAGIGPFLQWQRANLHQLSRQAALVFLLTVLIALYAISREKILSFWALLGFGAGSWLVGLSISEALKRNHGKIKIMIRLPRRHWGMILAHAGLGIAIFGMAGSVELKREATALLKPGQSMNVENYTITFQDMEAFKEQNYIADRALFSVEKNGAHLFDLLPEKRFYIAEKQITTEIAFHRANLSNLYLVLGDAQDEARQQWSVHLYYHPLINLLWLGAAIMVLGGALSLSDRGKNHA